MRAKMVVESVTKYLGDGEKLVLRAVTGGSADDNTFSKYTPSATLEMFVQNPDLNGKLQPGATFYVDFTQA
ncbi:MAG: hypothetical protein ABFE07_14300 [Armatimonadia bacterium]